MNADFFAHIGAHVTLSACALAIALAIGVPLAGLGADRPLPRGLALGLAGGLRVIPSIAILTLALPVLGLGFKPALLALVVLALPPILINTDVGLRSVPAATLDAARGLGMTQREVGLRVRWPLALPVVAVGVRIATVEVIASATLASFIGAGGLGDEIIAGFAGGDVGQLLLGAGTVTALALAADAVLAAVQRRLAA